MQKDVDLSSREWCDLVFEGKNKDFGAYEMRTTSVKRHNKAVLYTIIGAVLVVALAVSIAKVQEYIAERQLADQAEQEEVLIDMETNEPDEPEQERLEQPEPEVLPEEVLKSVKVTELAIVEDEKVKSEDEIKNQDELKETDTAFGQKDNDKGTEDRNVTKTLKDEVVVEKKTEIKQEKEEIFKSVEQMPTFPGGDAALMKYLSSHIQYPTAAAEKGIDGKVIVQFVVTSLPDFIPGRQNGQPVSVWYTLPVTFKLQNAN